MDAQDVLRIIETFVRSCPENSLKNAAGEPAWEEALIGFSSGADPCYEGFKDQVGDFHFLPKEIFDLSFPGREADSEDLTVIVWILPQREATKADNRAEDFYPSERWVRARFPGEDFNVLLRKHVVEELGKQGVEAVAPILSPEWKMVMSPKFGLSSRWSERHAAYASGLGTFGLCDGLITPKGKAHRVGSVVARIKIPPTPRPYKNHREYCLYFTEGGCMVCAERCPVGAISEKGHDKKLCWDHAGGTCGKYVKEHYGFDGYGCGLCQTAVPCESGIPSRTHRP
jgi:epoxyqueuosine reductase